MVHPLIIYIVGTNLVAVLERTVPACLKPTPMQTPDLVPLTTEDLLDLKELANTQRIEASRASF